MNLPGTVPNHIHRFADNKSRQRGIVQTSAAFRKGDSSPPDRKIRDHIPLLLQISIHQRTAAYLTRTGTVLMAYPHPRRRSRQPIVPAAKLAGVGALVWDRPVARTS